jgi:two-component system sensor histidine kinase BaeS
MLVGIVLPLVAGVALAVTIGGWESVGLAVVVLIGLGVLFAWGARVIVGNLGPVRDLIAAAGRLADGDRTARVGATTRAMQPVVSSFNEMAEQLETAELQRRRLLADLGHELRTPLTVIRGEIEAFADGVHEPTPERLDELLADVGVMERLLDDLHTLSTSEAGQLTLHREPTDLIDLAGSVVHNFAGAAATVELFHDVEHLDVEVDPVRIREVLMNLVGNAVRATGERGTVTVTVRGTDDDVIVTVTDTGVGIEPGRLEAVFDRFHKGSDSEGTGLGLTISRHLVEAHRGRIGIESTLGVGTTVEFELPHQVD